jgi:pSer/pThr/pTyr-binding forkhead associated (FHA) protein
VTSAFGSRGEVDRMTIRAQIPPSSESTAGSQERPTLGLEPHLGSIRNAFAMLDHRTRGRSVTRALAPPGRFLVVEDEGTERLIALDRPVIHIGRGITADIRLEDACISRRHAILAQLGDGARILDTRSSNGTFVNDQRVTVSYLRDGDLVRFGLLAMRFAEIAPLRRRPAARRIPLGSTLAA